MSARRTPSPSHPVEVTAMRNGMYRVECHHPRCWAWADYPTHDGARLVAALHERYPGTMLSRPPAADDAADEYVDRIVTQFDSPRWSQ